MPHFTPTARLIIARFLSTMSRDISRPELTDNFVNILRTDNHRFNEKEFRRLAQRRRGIECRN